MLVVIAFIVSRPSSTTEVSFSSIIPQHFGHDFGVGIMITYRLQLPCAALIDKGIRILSLSISEARNTDHGGSSKPNCCHERNPDIFRESSITRHRISCKLVQSNIPIVTYQKLPKYYIQTRSTSVLLLRWSQTLQAKLVSGCPGPRAPPSRIYNYWAMMSRLFCEEI